MSAESQVVIVGAGPTGLTLACELFRQGVPCRVIDQAPEPTETSRAIGVSTRSLEVFDGFGAGEEAIDRGHPIPATTLYSPRGPVARVVTSAASGTRYPFMLSLPQSETERILSDRLVHLGGFVERNVRLTGLRTGRDRVEATLDTPGGRETVVTNWLVGADGAHSAVRKACGIEFEGKETSVVFVIVDAHLIEGPPRSMGHYYFSPAGMLVCVPLPDGAYRLALTMQPDTAEEQALELDYIQSLARSRVPRGEFRIGALRNAGWGIGKVRIHTRVAARFRAGRCLLAGDAAHIYSPVGGQGMNGGIQDAHNLAWKLALECQGKARPGVLDSYEIERRAVARAVMRGTTAQTRLATMRSPVGITIRNAVVARASKSGKLDQRMGPQLAQLDIDYRKSPAIAKGSKKGHQGRRIPDAHVDGPPGAAPTLHGLLRQSPFTVLVLRPDAAGPALRKVSEAVTNRYGDLVAVHPLWADGTPVRGPDALVDRQGELHRHLGVTEATLCLVRPDGHVAFLGPIGARSSLLKHLKQTLRPRQRHWAR